MVEYNLGKSSIEPSKKIEIFEVSRREEGNETEVFIESRELLCSCPGTKQPDYYLCLIRYVPGRECIEKKSLELYLMTFRDEQHFAENLVHIIRDDLLKVVPSAKFLEVTLTQQIRGGIITKVKAFPVVSDIQKLIKLGDMLCQS